VHQFYSDIFFNVLCSVTLAQYHYFLLFFAENNISVPLEYNMHQFFSVIGVRL